MLSFYFRGISGTRNSFGASYVSGSVRLFRRLRGISGCADQAARGGKQPSHWAGKNARWSMCVCVYMRVHVSEQRWDKKKKNVCLCSPVQIISIHSPASRRKEVWLVLGLRKGTSKSNSSWNNRGRGPQGQGGLGGGVSGNCGEGGLVGGVCRRWLLPSQQIPAARLTRAQPTSLAANHSSQPAPPERGQTGEMQRCWNEARGGGGGVNGIITADFRLQMNKLYYKSHISYVFFLILFVVHQNKLKMYFHFLNLAGNKELNYSSPLI